MKMQKISAMILSVAMLFGSLGMASATEESTAYSTSIKVEAENYIAKNDAGIYDVNNYSGASNSKVVYYKGGAIADFKVTPEISGKYSIKAHVASNAQQYSNVIVDGKKYSFLGNELNTGGTGLSSAADVEYAQLYMNEGQEYTVQFYNGSSANLLFDYFTVELVGNSVTKIEAESGTVVKNNWIVSSDYGASLSDGKGVYFYGGGTGEFTVTVPSDGLYSVKAHVSSAADQWTWVTVNGLKGAQVGTGLNTGSLNPSSAVDKEYMQVSLLKGVENTIEFYNGGGNLFYFDYFTLERIGNYSVKQEAESGTIVAQSWIVSSDYSASLSGGKGVYFYGGGKGSFELTVPTDGKYSIKAHVSSAADQWTWVTVNGVKGSQVGTGISTGSTNPSTAKDIEYMQVDLYKDEVNTIEFYNGGSAFLYFDYFTVEKIGNALEKPDYSVLNLTAQTATISDNSHGTVLQGNGTMSFQNQDSLTWNTNVVEAGKYNIAVTQANVAGNRYFIYVDDKLVKTTGYLTPQSPSSFVSADYEDIATDISLTAGNHAIKIEIDNSAAVLTKFTLTRTADLDPEPEPDDTIIVLSSSAATISDNSHGTLVQGDGTISFQNQDSLTWSANVVESGKYNFSVTQANRSGNRYFIYVDDKLVKTTGYLTPQSPSSFVSADYENIATDISLTAGEHIIKAVIDNSAAVLTKFTLTKTAELDPPKESYQLLPKDGTIVDNDNGTGLIGTTLSFRHGDSIEWNVDFELDGSYSFTASKVSLAGIFYKLYFDDQLVNTTGWSGNEATWQSEAVDFSVMDALNIKAGTHKIKLELPLADNGGGTNGDCSLYSLDISRENEIQPIVMSFVPSSGNLANVSGNSAMQGTNLSFQMKDSITWTGNFVYSGKYQFTVKKASINAICYKIYVDGKLVALTDRVDADGSAWSGIEAKEYVIANDINILSGSHQITLEVPLYDKSGVENTACVFSKLQLDRTGEYEEIIVPELTIIDRLALGGVTINVDTSDTWESENERVYAAIYYNGRLKDIYSAPVTSQTTVMHLNSIDALTAEEKEKYAFKLFYWDDMSIVVAAPQYEMDLSTDIYVSINGSDNDDGTQLSPVATIEKAQTLARNASLNGASDVVVNIGPGEYTLTSPLSFDSLDTLSSGGTVSYIGSEDGQTIINGGQKITDWTLWQNGIYKANVNLSDLRQLWVNGNAAQRATSALMTASSQSGDTITIDNLPNGIKTESDLEIVWDRQWARQRFHVDAINENTLTLNRYAYSLENCNSNNRPSYDTPFKIENALYYLDEAGEFYFDNDYGVLYYKPQANEDITTANCYVGVSDGFMSINNADNLVFKNLTFENGTWMAPNTTGAHFGQDDQLLTADLGYANVSESWQNYCGGARVKGQIEVSNADNIKFDNVDINNVGSAGYSFVQSVTNSSVKNSQITGTSAGGIIIGTWNPLPGLICSNINVSNNIIENVAHEYGGQSAVKAYFVANTNISNNTISDAAYSAISIGWGWALPSVSGCVNNVIEKNAISGYMQELNDGAAIYVLGRSAYATVNNNYIEDITDRDPLKEHEASALYADSGATDTLFTNNVIKGSGQWLWINGFEANPSIFGVMVTNNYITDSGLSYSIVNDASIVTISGTVEYTGSNTQAQAIIDAAGANH